VFEQRAGSYDECMPTPFSNLGTGGSQNSLLSFEFDDHECLEDIVLCYDTRM
jgi:hypothetical protein